LEKSIWKQKNFLKMWGSQSFQSFAHILLLVVVMVKIYQMTDSVFGAALVLALMSISGFISGLIASYYINRFSLVKLLHFTGWSRGISTILVGLLLYHPFSYTLILILMVLFFSSFIGAWYQPARFALLPIVVSKGQYMKANGTITLVHQLIVTAGWGIGGLMSVYLPFQYIVGVIAVCFVISGVLVQLIKINVELNVELKEVKVNENPEPAWKKVFKIPIVRTITIMDFIEGLANAIWASAFLLVFTTVVLDKGTEWWGALNASYTIGSMIGSLIVISGLKIIERKIGVIIGLSALSMGTLTLFFAISPNAILAVILCILMGPMYSIRDICQETVLQDVIKPSERANILAARHAILSPWTGCTFLIMGYIADVFSIQAVYLLAAGLYLIASIIALLHPSLREYHYEAELTETT
jgi:hypothetical protein